jgi:hypothetical protein
MSKVKFRIPLTLAGVASNDAAEVKEASEINRQKCVTPQLKKRNKIWSKQIYLLALLPILLSGGVTYAQYGYQYNPPPPSQYPLMDEVADRFVQRYRQSSCEQLWQKREQPRSEREQQAIQALRNDPQMRAAFINRVAAPVANKMFECGMIP